MKENWNAHNHKLDNANAGRCKKIQNFVTNKTLQKPTPGHCVESSGVSLYREKS